MTVVVPVTMNRTWSDMDPNPANLPVSSMTPGAQLAVKQKTPAAVFRVDLEARQIDHRLQDSLVAKPMASAWCDRHAQQ